MMAGPRGEPYDGAVPASLRALCIALVSAHVLAASLPCTPAPEAASVSAPHAHGPDAHAAGAERHAHPGAGHADAGPDRAPCHAASPLEWHAKCPCGCDDAPDTGVAGHGLDPGLLAARAPVAEPFRAALAVAPAPAPPGVFLAGPDPIPLPA